MEMSGEQLDYTMIVFQVFIGVIIVVAHWVKQGHEIRFDVECDW